MPTGTGKTVCLLSLIVSYIQQKKPDMKLVYCTRTIVELEKTLEELKFVLQKRGDEELLALCLSSRKNMCVHPEVSKEDDRERVDSMCRQRTASWVRERAHEQQDNGAKMVVSNVVDIEDIGTQLCSFYENFQGKAMDMKIPSGVYTLEDMREYGR